MDEHEARRRLDLITALLGLAVPLPSWDADRVAAAQRYLAQAEEEISTWRLRLNAVRARLDGAHEPR